MNKEITKEEYFTLKGIVSLANKYNEKLADLERLACEITEADYGNIAGSSGHISDVIWGQTDLDKALEYMNIEKESV